MSGWLLRAMCVAAVPIIVAAGPTQLIPPDAVWRYSIVGDAPPPAGWERPGFDDRAWSQAVAGFSVGYSGYGQAATAVPSVRTDHGVTRGLLLRHEFLISDPASIHALFLRVDYEDGLIAWLNGVEVVRRGLPEDADPWLTLPSAHPPLSAELIDLSDVAHLLVNGTNLLALQVSDAVAGARTLFLWPELRANFTRGPLIQNVSSNRASVIWQTSPDVESWVEFWQDEDRRILNAPAAGWERAATLQGLKADTSYLYRVGIRTGEAVTWSESVTFRTLRSDGPVDFLVIGDTGSGHEAQHLVSAALRRENSDLVLHVGDLVYPGFTRDRVDLRCFSPYETWMRSRPLFPTIGNHEVYGSTADYLHAFHLPTNSLTGTELFYSFDHGDVHFVSLMLPWWGISELGFIGPDGRRSPQYQWLTNDLARTGKPWKVVCFHHPARSSGPHASEDFDLNGRADSIDILEALLPVFERNDVRLVFSGHDHLWERFAPTNAVHFVVSGGGGALRYEPYRRDAGSARVVPELHYVRVRIRGDHAGIEAVNVEGDVLDQFSIRRAPAEAESLEGAYHTPEPPPGISRNEDGNRPGEQFDLAGEGLITVSGRTANLGEFRVNYDGFAVHFGWRDVMLWPRQTMAVFIGASDRPGVTRLNEAGSSADHPLSRVNLQFAGFEPCLLLLLGDETADATDPAHRRPGNEIALGQGVFELNAELTPVPDADVRQFNRSPEGGPDPDEQNADFIVVSVPRAALGNPMPGDRLQVAAVAIAPALSGETLQIDTASLGQVEFKTGPVVILKPIDVTLATPPNGDVDLDGLSREDEIARGTDPESPDTDGDGLPDGWEVAHHLSPVIAEGRDGSAGDPDVDGYSNYEEFNSGTDPLDPRSTLRLNAAIEPDGLRLSWRTMVGRKYALESTGHLGQPFEPMNLSGFPRLASRTNLSVTIPFPTDAEQSRWYRVRELR